MKYLSMNGYKRTEYLVYMSCWILLVAFAVISSWAMVQNHTLLMMKRILGSVCMFLLPLFVFFLIHNFLIAPLLVYKKKTWLYCTLSVLLLSGFVAYQTAARNKAGHTLIFHELIPESRIDRADIPHDMPRHRPIRYRDIPHGPFTPDMAMNIFAFILACANLGVKYVCFTAANNEKVQTMKSENLGQQLQYLRYQINPHFFMNTLNNIHALVDIDPEMAKSSIVELSRLMRYILYDGNKPTIPLSKEAQFISQYVALMKIRYADDIDIDLSLPEGHPEGDVPPLVFVTFVENAFKHGISYEGRSFVKIRMDMEGKTLKFSCVNSRHPSRPADNSSGIGLENVRKRLSLLYGDKYSMKVVEDDDIYDVSVEIPLLRTEYD